MNCLHVRIPLESAIQLAKRYGVEDLLSKLIYFDPEKDALDSKPLHVKSSNSEPGTPKLTQRTTRGTKEFVFQSPPMDEFFDSQMMESSSRGVHSTSNPLFQQSSHLATPKRNYSPKKSKRGYQDGMEDPFYTRPEAIPTVSFSDSIKSLQIKTLSIPNPPTVAFPDISSLPLYQRQKSILSHIYIEGDSRMHDILGLLRSPYDSDSFELDLNLDEDGTTPLIWAASCGQLKLVALLLEKGADVHKVASFGETALMRALRTPSNYNNQTFPELLMLLKDIAYVTDVDYQSILHLVARSSTAHTRWKYSRYYSECIVDFLKSEAMRHISVMDFIDAQDITGNTALHYAFKQRNFKLIDLLLYMDARTDLPNMYGLASFDLAQKDFRMSKSFHSSSKKHGFHSSRKTLMDDDVPTPYYSDESDHDVSTSRIAAEYLLHAQTVSQLNFNYGNYVPKSIFFIFFSFFSFFLVLTSLNHSIRPPSPKERSPKEIQPVLQSPKQLQLANQNTNYSSKKAAKRLLTDNQEELFSVSYKKTRLEELYNEATQLNANSQNSRIQPPLFIAHSETPNIPSDQSLLHDISELNTKLGKVNQSKKMILDELTSLRQDRVYKDDYYEQTLSTLCNSTREEVKSLMEK